MQPRTAAAPADRRRHAPEPAGAGSFGHLRTDRSPDRALGASDGLLGLPMDAGGAGRLNHSSPSCLNRPAQRTDFFHGLLAVVGRPGRRPRPTSPRTPRPFDDGAPARRTLRGRGPKANRRELDRERRRKADGITMRVAPPGVRGTDQIRAEIHGKGPSVSYRADFCGGLAACRSRGGPRWGGRLSSATRPDRSAGKRRHTVRLYVELDDVAGCGSTLGRTSPPEAHRGRRRRAVHPRVLTSPSQDHYSPAPSHRQSPTAKAKWVRLFFVDGFFAYL